MIHTQDADFTLHQGDCVDILRELPPASVHCCVTSPPYWGLRDYGTGTWAGGDPDCDHVIKHDTSERTRYTPGGSLYRGGDAFKFQDVCGKCGATRVDQQLGLEQTPDEYVARMVDVFREVRRVLRDDGSLWLNLGDTYNSRLDGSHGGWNGSSDKPQTVDDRGPTNSWTGQLRKLAPKNLVGIPWRLAFALQADGWILRSDIIWSKPNPMPESVTDRPTKAHEYVFLLTKSARYYFDADAVREPHRWQDFHLLATNAQARQGLRIAERRANGDDSVVRTQPALGREKGRGKQGNHESEFSASIAGRNVRSVWEIATQPYAEAHFATFPQELARRCIAAGTSEHGCCPECGAPWEREIERTLHPVQRTFTSTAPRDGYNKNPEGHIPAKQTVTTTGWAPSCTHDRWPVPCTVLDPFLGSGTTALVARNLGRHSIGIELNPDYCQLAARRLQQQTLFA